VIYVVDQVHCAHILVKTEQEAKTILDMISKGASFSNLAAEKSMCPSGKRGGDLGTFGRGMMVREFEQAAFNLPKGQLSLPVKTQFGWHIIKRLE
jgi:parvulin-like peptidyl-prolyl isomerase